MSRLALPVIVLLVLCAGVQALPQTTNAVARESTVTAVVDRIEKSSRVVTFRSDGKDGSAFHSVYVDPALKQFDDLRVGDRVTVRYVESAIVKVRPNAKPSAPADQTEAARKAGNANVLSEVRAVVTIDSIDPDGQFVTYRTHDDLLATRSVLDKRVLQGLHAGDRVEVTLTQERAISIERGRR